ncbi:hypothetical protein J6590_039562 [Homalodisca vitripennis]|nr:hypothetical protein J6590_039562 [Homalodisca vitripennis]
MVTTKILSSRRAVDDIWMVGCERLRSVFCRCIVARVKPAKHDSTTTLSETKVRGTVICENIPNKIPGTK